MPINLAWEDQVTLVSATMVIHNFIHKTDTKDDDFMEAERNPNFGQHDTDDYIEKNTMSEPQFSNDAMNKIRDDICTSITFGRIGIPMN